MKPSIDLDQLYRMAEEKGIDLNSKLTKENAEVLNMAFLNNTSLPDNTMVRFLWNDKTNSCDVSVMCISGLKSSSSSGFWFLDDFYDSLGENGDLYKDIETRITPISNEVNSVDVKDFGLSEVHSFTIGGSGGDENSITLKQAFNNLNDDLVHDNWLFQQPLNGEINHANINEQFELVHGRDFNYGDFYEEVNSNLLYGDKLIGVKSGVNNAFTYGDGYLPPTDLNNLKNERIVQSIKDNMSKTFGSIPYEVVYDDINNTCSMMFNDPEKGPVAIEFDLRKVASGDIGKNIIGQIGEKVLSSEIDGFGSLKTNLYINEQLCKLSGNNTTDADFKIITLEDGTKRIVFESYSLPITDEDLNNPQNSKLIGKIVEAKSMEEKLSKLGFPASVEIVDIDGTSAYACYIDGEKKIFVKNDQGNYQELLRNEDGEYYISENVFNDINSAYDSSTINQKYVYNKKIARNSNKSISDIDEDKYNLITSGLEQIDIESSIIGLSDAVATLNKYGIDCSTNFNEFVNKFNNNVDLLSKLIKAAVNLYISCDTNMRAVFDRELYDGEDSLIDKMFQNKEKISADYGFNDNDFKEAFVGSYKQFVVDLEEDVKIAKELAGNGLCVQMDDDIRKLVEQRIKENDMKVDDVIRVHGDYTFIDVEAYSKLFDKELTLLGGKDYSDYSSILKEVNIDEKMANSLFKNPLMDYTASMMIFGESANSYSKTYDQIKSFEPFVEHVLNDDYCNELKTIREKGEGVFQDLFFKDDEIEISNHIIKLEDSFMSPAELAMLCYLSKMGNNNDQIVSASAQAEKYARTLEERVTDRHAKYLAANYVADRMVGNGVNIGDYLRENIVGVGDGLLSYPTALYHIFNAKDTLAERTRYYTNKLIAGDYDLNAVQNQFNSGELSENDYRVRSLLTGSSLISNSHKFSDSEKKGLTAFYEVGKTSGTALFEVGLEYAFALCGTPTLLQKAVLNGLKGLKAAGETRNKFDNKAGFIDESKVNLASAEAGLVTFGIGFGVDYLSSFVMGKPLTLKTSSPPSVSSTSMLAESAKNNQTIAPRLAEMWRKFKEKFPKEFSNGKSLDISTKIPILSYGKLLTTDPDSTKVAITVFSKTAGLGAIDGLKGASYNTANGGQYGTFTNPFNTSSQVKYGGSAVTSNDTAAISKGAGFLTGSWFNYSAFDSTFKGDFIAAGQYAANEFMKEFVKAFAVGAK